MAVLFVFVLLITLSVFNVSSVYAVLGCTSAGPYSAVTGQLCDESQSIATSLRAKVAGAFDTLFEGTLRVGSKGDAVEMLQRVLGGVVADGSFGPLTREAVRGFQTVRGLTPDGVVGPRTSAAIIGSLTSSAASTTQADVLGSLTVQEWTGNKTITIVPMHKTGTPIDNGLAARMTQAMLDFYQTQSDGKFSLTATTAPALPLDSCPGITGLVGSQYSTDFVAYVWVGKTLNLGPDAGCGTLNGENGPKGITVFDTASTEAIEGNGLVHELGHALGLDHINENNIMHPSRVSFPPFPDLNTAQKQQLGWLPDGISPPTPAPADGCPGRVCEPLVNTEFGNYALTCPATPVQAQRNGVTQVEMMAVGTYAAGQAAVTVPVRPLGTRLTPNLGIRQSPPGGWYGLSPGDILNFPIQISSEVSLGNYTVPMRATLTDYEPGSTACVTNPKGQRVCGTGEPRLAEKYSYCNLQLQVIANTGPAPDAPMVKINSFLGAGVPVKEIRPIVIGTIVPIQWQSRGVSSCFLEVNKQPSTSFSPRALPTPTTGGDFTSDPVHADGDDIYKMSCQITGTTGLQPEHYVEDSLVVGYAGVTSPGPGGGLFVTIDGQGSTQPFYGSIPRDEAGRALPFVHVGSGGTITFIWTSQNASACSVQPVGLTGQNGAGSVSGIAAPFDLKVTCTGTSGGQMTKSLRVVLNPGESVTGTPYTKSISCSPNQQGVLPDSDFFVDIQSIGNITGPLSFTVSYFSPAENPKVSLKSPTEGYAVGSNRLTFHMGPLANGKLSSTFIDLSAKDGSSALVGSCRVVADPGVSSGGNNAGNNAPLTVGTTFSNPGTLAPQERIALLGQMASVLEAMRQIMGIFSE